MRKWIAASQTHQRGSPKRGDPGTGPKKKWRRNKIRKKLPLADAEAQSKPSRVLKKRGRARSTDRFVVETFGLSGGSG